MCDIMLLCACGRASEKTKLHLINFHRVTSEPSHRATLKTSCRRCLVMKSPTRPLFATAVEHVTAFQRLTSDVPFKCRRPDAESMNHYCDLTHDEEESGWFATRAGHRRKPDTCPGVSGTLWRDLFSSNSELYRGVPRPFFPGDSHETGSDSMRRGVNFHRR